jgi:Rod binding domain-containing protein
VSRLEALSGTEKVAPADIAAPAAESVPAWSTDVSVAAADTSQPPRLVSTTAASKGSGAKNGVYVEFEALLLQNMVESMMPEDAQAVFGSGTAGKIWKSMLAENIAAEIARSGTLGIAKQIAAGPTAAAPLPRAEIATHPKQGDSV